MLGDDLYPGLRHFFVEYVGVRERISPQDPQRGSKVHVFSFRHTSLLSIPPSIGDRINLDPVKDFKASEVSNSALVEAVAQRTRLALPPVEVWPNAVTEESRIVHHEMSETYSMPTSSDFRSITQAEWGGYWIPGLLQGLIMKNCSRLPVNAQQLAGSFSDILTAIAKLFSIGPTLLRIFWDVDQSLWAFNRGGILHFSLRAYVQTCSNRQNDICKWSLYFMFPSLSEALHSKIWLGMSHLHTNLRTTMHRHTIVSTVQ